MTHDPRCIGLEGVANTSSHVLLLSNSNTQRISRLPNEILATIFIHYAQDYYSEHLGQPARTLPGWVNVSYVCRYWRNVALSYPALWTHVFFTSLRWTEELLARSKQSPLKVQVESDDVSDEWYLASLEKVMGHMERIQELCLDIPEEGSWTERILDKLSLRAPLLQHLKLSTVKPSRRYFELFNGDTPSLRTLDLTNCPRRWYSLKLIRLTNLRLKNIRTEPGDLLAALSGMQDLSYLYLIDVLPRNFELLSGAAASGNLPSIKFPRLSRLLLDDTLSGVTQLLFCVKFPPNTQVRLHCQLWKYYSLNAYALLSSVLAEKFYASTDSALPNPTMRSLIIGEFGDIPIAFSVLEHDHDAFAFGDEVGSDYADYTDWDRNVPLQIQIHHSHGPAIRDIICEICCAMPVDNVQSLHVVSPPTSLDFWKRILGRIPGLRYLKLSRGEMPKIASLLSVSPRIEDPATAGDEVGDTNGILVPTLEELELDRIRFAAEPPACISAVVLAQVSRLSALQDALSTRIDPPVRLEMLSCTASW